MNQYLITMTNGDDLLTNELSQREKCFVVQMMLRQSPKLKILPEGYIKALHVFYRENVYPELTPQDINQINVDLDKFLTEAESKVKSGLMKSIGKEAFAGLAKKFGLGKETDEGTIDAETLKQMESIIREEADKNDGS